MSWEEEEEVSEKITRPSSLLEVQPAKQEELPTVVHQHHLLRLSISELLRWGRPRRSNGHLRQRTLPTSLPPPNPIFPKSRNPSWVLPRHPSSPNSSSSSYARCGICPQQSRQTQGRPSSSQSPRSRTLSPSVPSPPSFSVELTLFFSRIFLPSDSLFKFPVTLTIVQFFFVALYCWLWTRPALGMGVLREPSRALLRGVLPMAAFQIGGHVFSSVATSRVPVSTVHTIKVSLCRCALEASR